MTTTTTKYDLYFVARNGKSFITVTTKAQGRNAEGVMTYEAPSVAFNRASREINFKTHKFTEVKPYH